MGKMRAEMVVGNHRFLIAGPRNLADSMKPQAPDDAPQDDLFRHRLDNIVLRQHPLVWLAERIDWDGMNRLLGEYCEDAGRAATEADTPDGRLAVSRAHLCPV